MVIILNFHSSGMVSADVGGESVIMIVGGDQDPDTSVSSVEIYNRRRSTWSSAPSTLQRRDCCRLAVVEGEWMKYVSILCPFVKKGHRLTVKSLSTPPNPIHQQTFFFI